MNRRPDPFALAFGPFAPDRFEVMRRELAREGVDPFERDAWVLSRPGTELLRELRPEESLGEGVGELVALAHAAFVYWQQGERVVTVGRDALDAMLLEDRPREPGAGGPTAYYVELAPHRVWGTPVAGAPPEPLDGWFAVGQGERLGVVAVFGLFPGRPGFTVAEAAGPPAGPLRRADGSLPFAPVLAGGAPAGLWSVIGAEELLELGWRVHWRVGRAGGPTPGHAEVAS